MMFGKLLNFLSGRTYNVKSSFVESVRIEGDQVTFKMKKSKVAYVYTADPVVIAALEATIENGYSVGQFFNEYFKNSETEVCHFV